MLQKIDKSLFFPFKYTLKHYERKKKHHKSNVKCHHIYNLDDEDETNERMNKINK